MKQEEHQHGGGGGGGSRRGMLAPHEGVRVQQPHTPRGLVLPSPSRHMMQVCYITFTTTSAVWVQLTAAL